MSDKTFFASLAELDIDFSGDANLIDVTNGDSGKIDLGKWFRRRVDRSDNCGFGEFRRGLVNEQRGHSDRGQDDQCPGVPPKPPICRR